MNTNYNINNNPHSSNAFYSTSKKAKFSHNCSSLSSANAIVENGFNLNLDILSQIFTFLKFKDQWRAAAVSRIFKEAIDQARENDNWRNHFVVDTSEEDNAFNLYDYFNWHTRRLKHYPSLSVEQTINDKISLDKIINDKISIIKQMKMSNYIVVYQFSQSLKLELKELELEDLTIQITNDFKDLIYTQIFNLILNKCKNLKKLSLNWHNTFKVYEGLSDLIKKVSSTTFNLIDNKSEHVAKFADFCEQNKVQVNILEITYDVNQDAATEDDIIRILNNSSSLTQMKFGERYGVYSENLIYALANHKNLTDVDLGPIVFTQDHIILQALTTLTKNCQQLLHLSYEQFPSIILSSVPSESDQEWYKYCPQLRSLTLIDFDSTTANNIRVINNETNYNIRYISNTLSNLPNLTYLHLKPYCEANIDVTGSSHLDQDMILKILAANNKKLEKLQLGYYELQEKEYEVEDDGPIINGNGIVTLIKNCEKIHTLDFSSQVAMTPELFKILIDRKIVFNGKTINLFPEPEAKTYEQKNQNQDDIFRLLTDGLLN